MVQRKEKVIREENLICSVCKQKIIKCDLCNSKFFGTEKIFCDSEAYHIHELLSINRGKVLIK